jgi:hypothetical protein
LLLPSLRSGRREEVCKLLFGNGGFGWKTVSSFVPRSEPLRHLQRVHFGALDGGSKLDRKALDYSLRLLNRQARNAGSFFHERRANQFVGELYRAAASNLRETGDIGPRPNSTPLEVISAHRCEKLDQLLVAVFGVVNHCMNPKLITLADFLAKQVSKTQNLRVADFDLPR